MYNDIDLFSAFFKDVSEEPLKRAEDVSAYGATSCQLTVTRAETMANTPTPKMHRLVLPLTHLLP